VFGEVLESDAFSLSSAEMLETLFGHLMILAVLRHRRDSSVSQQKKQYDPIV